MKIVPIILLGVLCAVLSLAACGGDSDTSAPTTAQIGVVPIQGALATTSPNALILPIGVKGDRLEFNRSELTAPTGTQVSVYFTNESTVFEHNWVLVESGTKDAVAAIAGPENDWIPPGDSRIIAHTRLVCTGYWDDRVTFITPAADNYQFVCTLHSNTMFGDFVVTE